MFPALRFPFWQLKFIIVCTWLHQFDTCTPFVWYLIYKVSSFFKSIYLAFMHYEIAFASKLLKSHLSDPNCCPRLSLEVSDPKQLILFHPFEISANRLHRQLPHSKFFNLIWLAWWSSDSCNYWLVIGNYAGVSPDLMGFSHHQQGGLVLLPHPMSIFGNFTSLVPNHLGICCKILEGQMNFPHLFQVLVWCTYCIVLWC